MKFNKKAFGVGILIYIAFRVLMRFLNGPMILDAPLVAIIPKEIGPSLLTPSAMISNLIQVELIHLLVLLIWGLPFLVFFLFGKIRAIHFFATLVFTELLIISLSLTYLPSFISGKMSYLILFTVNSISTPKTLVLFSVVMLIAFFTIVWRSGRSWRLALAASFYILSFFAWDLYCELRPLKLDLKKDDKFLLIVESFGASHLNQDKVPFIYELSKHENAQLAFHVPEVDRTVPSVHSMLKGRVSVEDGVFSLLPSPLVFNQSDKSLPSLLKSSDHCTIISGNSSAATFSKLDYGFDYKNVGKDLFLWGVRDALIMSDLLLIGTFATRPFLNLLPEKIRFLIMGDYALAADRYAVERAQQLINQCRKNFKNKPIFLSLHLSESHFPYAARFPRYSFGPEYQWTQRKVFVFDHSHSNLRETYYSQSLVNSDHLIKDLFSNSGFLGPSGPQIVVTGDHYNESRELGFHGDTLPDVDYVKTPFIFLNYPKIESLSKYPYFQTSIIYFLMSGQLEKMSPQELSQQSFVNIFRRAGFCFRVDVCASDKEIHPLMNIEFIDQIFAFNPSFEDRHVAMLPRTYQDQKNKYKFENGTYYKNGTRVTRLMAPGPLRLENITNLQNLQIKTTSKNSNKNGEGNETKYF